LCSVGLVGLVGFVGIFAYSYSSLASEMPELDDYNSQELAQTSVVYDINGDIVDELYGVQNRRPLPRTRRVRRRGAGDWAARAGLRREPAGGRGPVRGRRFHRQRRLNRRSPVHPGQGRWRGIRRETSTSP